MVDANLLLDLVTVARRPVPLRVCAAALDASENDVIEAATDLVSEGSLVESTEGYAVPEGTPEPPPVRSARAARVLARGLIAYDADPEWIGSALARSDTPGEAIPYLVRAADELAAGGRVIDAMSPAAKVLEYGSGVDRETEGRMHLIRGRGRQFTGDSVGASDDFEDAAARLEGEPRIDALGFAATGASNLQQPQRAERLLATAAAESFADFPAKLGSLCALWAREVSRLGFPDEAEALLDKSDALLDEHGSSFQRYLAKWNRAWIYVDRGDYRRAEADLDALVHTAEDQDHGASDIAEKKAYHGRALFGFGRPKAAMERLEEASADATPSIRYLMALAESEGYPRYGAWSEALEATDRLSESVEELVPAWRNVSLFLRAKALVGSGQLEEARRTVSEAILACPPGVNGWRWRQRCRALQMDLAARAGEPFPAEEAEGLVEEMLRAQWLGPAAELLVAMARHTKAPERARQAMALAWKGGDVMLAAEAADVARAWDSELASPIVDRVRRIEGELDEDMAASLRQLPHAAAALAVERDVSEDETALRAEFEEALTAVLGDDPTLTPAQRRRAKTLAARRRRRSFLTGFGSVAVLALGVLVSGIILGWFEGPQPTTTTTAPTTTTSTTTYVIECPENMFGDTPFRGGALRNGVAEGSGIDAVDGWCFRLPTTGVLPTSPVVAGNNVYVGSDRFLFAFRLNGTQQWRFQADDTIASAPVVGVAEVADEAGTRQTSLIVFGSDDGNVYAIDTADPLVATWRFPTGSRVVASPLITDGVVVAASTSGRAYAINAEGVELWQYPAADADPAAGFRGDPAVADGVVYLADEDGVLHAVRLDDGTGVCTARLLEPATVGAAIGDDFVIAVSGRSIQAFRKGTCDPAPFNSTPNNAGFTSTPTLGPDRMYFPNNQLMIAASYDGSLDELSYLAGASIGSPVVLAQGVVYFGDNEGTVYALDAETLEEIWTFRQWDDGVLTAPAVIDDAVIVVTEAGEVVALAER